MLYTHEKLTCKNSKIKNFSEEIRQNLLVDVLRVQTGKKWLTLLLMTKHIK